MKRRIRKKLRLREFAELGFEVRFRLPWSADDQRLDEFWDEFVGYLEAHGLFCAGASGSAWDVVVYRGPRAAASDHDRIDVSGWLLARAEVAELCVGPLIDVWRAA